MAKWLVNRKLTNFAKKVSENLTPKFDAKSNFPLAPIKLSVMFVTATQTTRIFEALLPLLYNQQFRVY